MPAIQVKPKSCTGCRFCEIVCGFQHEQVCRPAGSWIRVQKDESQGTELPVVCRQCDNPRCAAVCGSGALYRDESSGLVGYDPGRCSGCGACIGACAWGAIWSDPGSGKVLKCDLCGGEPACVRYCPTQTLTYDR